MVRLSGTLLTGHLLLLVLAAISCVAIPEIGGSQDEILSPSPATYTFTIINTYPMIGMPLQKGLPFEDGHPV